MATSPGDYIIEVRDRSLKRVGQIPRQIVNAKIQPIRNAIGSWSLKLPIEEPMAAALSIPGYGVVITDYQTKQVVMSGPMTTPSRRRTAGDKQGIITVSGVSDSVLLWDKICWPDPAMIFNRQRYSHDVRSGPAETVMREFLNMNLLNAPQGGRPKGYLDSFIVDTPSTGLGRNVEKSVRYAVLGDILAEIANYAGLIFDLVQQGNVIVLRIRQTVDRSREIRLDIENGTLSEQGVSMAPPEVTNVIVAGQGEGVQRKIVYRTTAAAIDSMNLWGRAIEGFKDQRNTNSDNELHQSAEKILEEGAATIVSVKAIASNDQTMIFGKDWNVGDKVTVVIEKQETQSIVTEAAIVLDDSGLTTGAAIGSVEKFNSTSAAEANISSTIQRTESIEREGVGTLRTVPAGSMIPYAGINSPAGWLLCDGRAVSRTEFKSLFEAIGVLYGPGDGSTTFNLPNMRGRAPFGAGLGTSVQANNFDTSFPNFVFIRDHAGYPSVAIKYYNNNGINSSRGGAWEPPSGSQVEQLIGFVGNNNTIPNPPALPTTGVMTVGKDYAMRLKVRSPNGSGVVRQFRIRIGSQWRSEVAFLQRGDPWYQIEIKFTADAPNMPMYFEGVAGFPAGGDANNIGFDEYELYSLDDAGLAFTGGAKTVTLTEAQMPAHDHDFNGHTFSWGTNGTVSFNSQPQAIAGAATGNGLHTFQDQDGWADTLSKGGGQSHENMPPFLNVNYLIRT